MSDRLLVLYKTVKYLSMINLFVGNTSDLVLQALSTLLPLGKSCVGVHNRLCPSACDLTHVLGEPSVTSGIPFGVSCNTALPSDVLNDYSFVQ